MVVSVLLAVGFHILWNEHFPPRFHLTRGGPGKSESAGQANAKIPWNLIDHEIERITRPSDQVRALAYKATALAKLGDKKGALETAGKAKDLMVWAESDADPFVHIMGDFGWEEIAIAYSWAQAESSMEEALGHIHNHRTKSLTESQCALALALTNHPQAAQRLFGQAQAEIVQIRGFMVGRVDAAPLLGHGLEKLGAAWDRSDTVIALGNLAKCQFSAGFADAGRHTAENALAIIREAAKTSSAENTADLAMSLANIDDKNTIDAVSRLRDTMSETDRDFDMGVALLMMEVGRAWARLQEPVLARVAFEEARNSLGNVAWSLQVIHLAQLARYQAESALTREDARPTVKQAMLIVRRYYPTGKILDNVVGRAHLDFDDIAQLYLALVRLGDFPEADQLEAETIEPPLGSIYHLVKAAAVVGNLERASQYADRANDSAENSEGRLALVQSLIGPLDSLCPPPKQPRSEVYHHILREPVTWLMSLLMMVMPTQLLFEQHHAHQASLTHAA